MLSDLFTWLCSVNLYMLHVLIVVNITPGRGISIMILLYCVTATYDMITSLGHEV